jgi:peptidoglycan hydrolase-like protein with peptidoglycan-binding domain
MTSEGGPAPGTTLALVFGASHWPDAPKFEDAPSFEQSANALIEYLRDPDGFGLPWANIKIFFNSLDDAAEQLEQAKQFIERRRRQAIGTAEVPTDLLVFFVGHGDFEGEPRDFYLSIRRTHEERPLITSITARELGNLIRRAAGDLRTYLIVDCCFAAALQHGFMTSGLGLAEMRLHEALPHGTLATEPDRAIPPSGVALLASAGLNDPALAPRDNRLTAFTAALLDVLRTGSARFGPRLSLQDVHFLVERRLAELFPDATRPEMRPLRQALGRVELVPLLPNPAFQRAQKEQRRHAEAAAGPAEQKPAVEEAGRLPEEGRPAAEEAARPTVQGRDAEAAPQSTEAHQEAGHATQPAQRRVADPEPATLPRRWRTTVIAAGSFLAIIVVAGIVTGVSRHDTTQKLVQQNNVEEAALGQVQQKAAEQAARKEQQVRDQLSEVQSRLLAMGLLDGGYDAGQLDLRTREAIRAFQLSENLPADGQVSEALLEQLRGSPPSPVSRARALAGLAAEAARNNKDADAIRLYTDSTNLDPGNLDVMIALSALESKTGHSEDAQRQQLLAKTQEDIAKMRTNMLKDAASKLRQ